MRILFIVPYVPSLIRRRSYNLIREIAHQGHQVILACLWSDQSDFADLADLRAWCEDIHALELSKQRSLLNCLQALPGRTPLQSAFSWSPAFSSLLDDLMGAADVVHVEHLRGGRYALQAAAARQSQGPPVVWDSVDSISYLFRQAVVDGPKGVQRLIHAMELPRTERYEASLVGKFDRVIVSGERDRRELIELAEKYFTGSVQGGSQPKTGLTNAPCTGEHVHVIPNGVDLDYFCPGDGARQADTLIFSGKMSYHANIAAATYLLDDIMPLVWAENPDIKLWIVGKDPPGSLRKRAQSNGTRVTITGTVPDIRPYIQEASLAVVPILYGAGSQVKIIEAMACGTPVVASPRAVSALDVRVGRDVAVAENAHSMAESIVDLLQDPKGLQEMSQAGRVYVENHHDWKKIAARLGGLYDEIA